MSIMKVIASAAGESAVEPWGNKMTGALQSFSIAPESWLEAQDTNSNPSLIASTVAWTFSMSVPEEPPTRIILLPAEAAAMAFLAASSGVWPAGSMRMACLVGWDLSQRKSDTGPSASVMSPPQIVGGHGCIIVSMRVLAVSMPALISVSTEDSGSLPPQLILCTHFPWSGL